MIRRLDVKFVLILILTATIPMAVSVHLVSTAALTALGVGVNKDIENRLKQSVSIHRKLIDSIKRNYDLQVTQLAGCGNLIDACRVEDFHSTELVLKQYFLQHKDILQIVLSLTDGTEIQQTRIATDKYHRELTKEQAVDEGHCDGLRVVFQVDNRLTADFNAAGRDLEVYQALVGAPRTYLRNRIIFVYATLLGLVLAISIWQGIYWTRRWTRRVHVLSSATQQVAQGDLSIHVEPGSQDEVGQLIVSFNKMVSEIATNRTRMEYLQKISAWQEIARRLAHEIKNPLTPIQLAVQELKSQYKGDSPAFGRLLAESAEIIEEEVATLRRLVTDFSSFARMPQIVLEVTDLGEFLKDCELSMGHFKEHLNLALEWQLPQVPVPVAIDAMMLKRVVDNLLRNAGEAMQESGVEDARVRISTIVDKKGKRREVQIRFEDNGPGILPEHLASLFEPYFTTKTEGTGLGLAIAKKVVLEHGGRIGIEASSGPGVTLVVVLPVAS